MGTRRGLLVLPLLCVLPALLAAQTSLPTSIVPAPDSREVVPAEDGFSAGYEAQKSDLKTPLKTSQVKQALSDVDEKKSSNSDAPTVGSLDDDLGNGPELGMPAKGEKVDQALSALNGNQMNNGPADTPTPPVVISIPTPEL